MKTKTLLLITIGLGFFVGYIVGASMDPIDRAIRKAHKINRANLRGVSSLREGGSWNLFGIFQKTKTLQEKVQTDLGFSNQYITRISNTIQKKETAIDILEEVKEFIALAKQEVFIDNSLQTYLVSLGKLQLENGMIFKSITNLQKSYEINPYDSSTAYLLAMSYLGLYQILPESSDKSQAGENAIRFLRLSLISQPNNINIIHGLALIYTDQGLYTDAKNFFLQILDKNPEHIDSLLGLARIYYDQGDVDRARRLYEQTEALILELKNRRSFLRQKLNIGVLDQKLTVIRNNLAIIYQSQGNPL
ncbi:MAG: tetratricopeptide repeat protein [Brevinema sp.]